ncbi:hypothetical protein IT409_00060 [Candidatus Falkowbacteria bacterium]|nr:hypothetical protein [Candidatus Falkowbacteria bacterium]
MKNVKSLFAGIFFCLIAVAYFTVSELLPREVFPDDSVIYGVMFYGFGAVMTGMGIYGVLASNYFSHGRKLGGGMSGGELLLTTLTYLTASMGVGMFGAAIVLGGLLFTEQEVAANSRMLNEMIVAGFVSIVSALIMARRLEDERKISRKIPTVADVMATMR